MKIEYKDFAAFFSAVLAVFIVVNYTFGQEVTPKDKIEGYKDEVRQMVSYLEFSMNVIGNPSISAKEKDIIVNESYLKVFRDDEVQIEDDLDENRDVVTNKDVQAYLKDVDFFFKQVKFDFNILDIANDLNHEGNLFFTVKIMRNLDGITVENDSINSDQLRYIEVNVDEENKDLRIASIYTTKLSQNEELTIWWAELTDEWRTVLGVDIEIREGLRLSDIQEFSDSTYLVDYKQITDSLKIINYVKVAAAKEEVNLSGSIFITDLKPLDQLKNLKKLDISSSNILDLFPIRNLTTIEYLDCSNTRIEDLNPLKYSKSLRELYINNTPVTDISVVENFENLEIFHLEQTVIDSLPAMGKLLSLRDLNCSSTNLEQLDSLQNLRNLQNLNISNTIVDDLKPIANLKQLKKLTFNYTNVQSLEPLNQLAILEEVAFENSQVSDLTPLKGMQSLKVIFADRSNIGLNNFTEFSKSRPDVNIVFITKDLNDFWENLDKTWTRAIKRKFEFGDTIAANQMHEILKVRELDVSAYPDVSSLEPLKYMPLLEELNFSGTKISDLGPIDRMTNLRILEGANSKVRDLSPIRRLVNLEKINFENTDVEDITPISGLHRLDSLFFNGSKVRDLGPLNMLHGFKIAYFDRTQVTDENVLRLSFNEDSSIVIYKTDKLRTWWGNMDDSWQDLFIDMFDLSRRPSSKQLHKLACKKVLDVHSTSLRNLDPIPEMVRLRSLSFTDSRITSLYPLIGLKNLKELKCPRNPISDISALSSLDQIQVLDLDNTQVSDLKSIRSLIALRELKFSGTEVKDISPVAGMVSLETLEFSKTRVKKIKALFKLSRLKVLKCYNNKISAKKIEDFKEKNPNCEVVFY